MLFWLVHGLVDVMDFSPIRQALRFNVYDHVGLLECPSITTKELLSMLEPFKDPLQSLFQLRRWYFIGNWNT